MGSIGILILLILSLLASIQCYFLACCCCLQNFSPLLCSTVLFVLRNSGNSVANADFQFSTPAGQMITNNSQASNQHTTVFFPKPNCSPTGLLDFTMSQPIGQPERSVSCRSEMRVRPNQTTFLVMEHNNGLPDKCINTRLPEINKQPTFEPSKDGQMIDQSQNSRRGQELPSCLPRRLTWPYFVAGLVVWFFVPTESLEEQLERGYGQ